MRGERKSAWRGALSAMLFIVMSLTLFSRAMHKKAESCILLQEKIEGLESLKNSFLEEKGDLLLQLNSRNDKDWIEMVLKKRLGVVPEGQMKVYFKKDDP